MLFYQATIRLCSLASLQCDVHHAVLLQQEVSLITFKNQRFITSHITSRWFISLLVYDYAVAQTVTPHPVKLSDLVAANTRKCIDIHVRVCQHHGSRWALPRARLSALCQALFISSSASPQRFCTNGSETSLWGSSTCVRRGCMRVTSWQ